MGEKKYLQLLCKYKEEMRVGEEMRVAGEEMRVAPFKGKEKCMPVKH